MDVLLVRDEPDCSGRRWMQSKGLCKRAGLLTFNNQANLHQERTKYPSFIRRGLDILGVELSSMITTYEQISGETF